MADQAPKRVIVAAFDEMDGGNEAYARLKQLESDKAIKIDDAAILMRDLDNKLHVHDVKDMTGTRGAVLGGVMGAVVGAITGPVGWVTIGGAAIGGLVAKLRDSGFDQERLEEWGDRLEPGTSAIVAVIDDLWVIQVEQALRETAREVMALEVGQDVAKELETARS